MLAIPKGWRPHHAQLIIGLLNLEARAHLATTCHWFRQQVVDYILHNNELSPIVCQHNLLPPEQWMWRSKIDSNIFSVLRALADKKPLIHVFAEAGDSDVLRSLHILEAYDSLRTRTPCSQLSFGGDNIAHIAARRGHSVFIRTLHELGYDELLQAPGAKGWTIAHCALDGAHEPVLLLIQLLGYGHLFGKASDSSQSSIAMHHLVKEKLYQIKHLESLYKNGRLAGSSSTVQNQRRKTKQKLRRAVDIITTAREGHPP